jgi:two-component system cell cycle sensor histidine kinase/response regulator CckA
MVDEGGRRGRILVVDDEPRMCESLKMLLGAQGHEVRTTHSGREAQRLLGGEIFDVVLLDMVMPDMDGQRLMDYINGRDAETCVIVITGHASVDSAIGALKRGAYDYVRKPFEFDELTTTVRNALDRRRLRRENRLISGKLQLSEERYRYLVENSPDIIYTLDREGRFTFISRAVERLLGYRSEALIGRHYGEIIYEEDLDKARWFFNERRTGERAAGGVELRLKGANGHGGERSYEVRHLTIELKSTGVYDEAGGKRYLGTHGVARDISDRRRLEAQFQHAQKMEAVGTLAGGIAHDFNNLLMGIQGYTSLMLLKIDPHHPHYEKLRNIEKYVQSGAELTKQLLGFARGGKYDVKATDVNDLVHTTAHMFGRTKKEIRIHETYQDGLWPAKADPGQVEQVLLNLFVNAWQAMPGGGDLYLETANVTLSKPSKSPQDPMSGSSSATPASAWTRPRAGASSNPSSPQRRWAAAPDSASPPPTASSKTTTASSMSTAAPTQEPPSASSSLLPRTKSRKENPSAKPCWKDRKRSSWWTTRPSSSRSEPKSFRSWDTI